MRMEDTIEFKAMNGAQSACGILADVDGESAVVVAIDLDRGCSVTNSWPLLAQVVVQRLGISPFNVIWYEHYPKTDAREETFDRVYPSLLSVKDGAPQYGMVSWEHSTREEVEGRLGFRVGDGGDAPKPERPMGCEQCGAAGVETVSNGPKAGLGHCPDCHSYYWEGRWYTPEEWESRGGRV